MNKLEEMKNNLYIGSMGWSYDFWDLYPRNTLKRNYLEIYSKIFNSVEINSSFYRIPSISTVEKWAEQTPKSFKFSTKFPRSITHVKDLNFEFGRLGAFMKNINHLGPKLGPFLIQFPPRFHSRKKVVLSNFLKKLPEENHYAIEFRNKSWLTEETSELLKQFNISMVRGENHETNYLPSMAESFVYIRLEGDREKVNGEKGKVEVERHEALDLWSKHVSSYLENSQDVYVYVSKYFSGYPPSDIEYLYSKIQK
jgi:uncharacterized protein YecE (DUF72 family)